ncbi:S8 family serine peptidase [Actinoplanes sp. NBRC 103695]|uniref:S8 family serine peptidase n=1 Tax=Actinoplanes sp. NBRC 103695 TaxID=3032202 RepID=UPI002552762D|nr:S8 family serine peptidase [Actinoplanes sp. NBRC 103695]
MAAAVMVTVGVTAGPALAAEEYVKYYAVTSSYQGKPENLTEIAERFLGDGARSAEILDLNSGRKQPDNGRLADPNELRAGWLLVMPWDAVGGPIHHGVLPDKAPTTQGQPKSSTPQKKLSQQQPRTTVPPEQLAAAASVPSKAPVQRPAAKSGQCAAAAASSGRSDWAGLRLAPDKAWPQSRGKGQMVAIVDSGVDGSLSALSGHVAVGMDITTGKGRGDTDCLGSGTAMAGLIVGRPGKGSTVKGLAPETTVMPVRIVGTDAKAQPANAASAIEAAVGAGATVIALGNFVDTTQTEVAKAITAAAGRDVLVVMGASLGSVPVNPDAKIGDGVLRVGGVGADSQRAADYRGGGIDVVAPGINVNSIGITGVGSVSRSGTPYAVALVAGTAALVRAAYPDLTAEQVAHRIEVTSEKMGDGPQPDGKYGWGMINPAAAVTTVLSEEAGGGSRSGAKELTSGTSSGGRTTLLVLVTLVALAAAALLIFRIRRIVTEPDDQYDDDGGAGGPTTEPPTVPSLAAAHLPWMAPPSSPVRPDGRLVEVAAASGGPAPAGSATPNASAGAKASQPPAEPS